MKFLFSQPILASLLRTQSKSQSPQWGPQGPTRICLFPLPSPPSFSPWLTLLQPHWLLCCSSSTPTALQLQDLCTCSSCHLNGSSWARKTDANSSLPPLIRVCSNVTSSQNPFLISLFKAAPPSIHPFSLFYFSPKFGLFHISLPKWLPP